MHWWDSFLPPQNEKKASKRNFNVFFGVPHLATCICLFSVSEPGLGVKGIHPGMDLTPFPCIIWNGRDSNPQPFGGEPSSLTTTPSFHSLKKIFTSFLRFEARNRYVTSFLVQF